MAVANAGILVTEKRLLIINLTELPDDSHVQGDIEAMMLHVHRVAVCGVGEYHLRLRVRVSGLGRARARADRPRNNARHALLWCTMCTDPPP